MENSYRCKYCEEIITPYENDGRWWCPECRIVQPNPKGVEMKYKEMQHFGDTYVFTDMNSVEALEVTTYYDEGRLLPEPHRSRATTMVNVLTSEDGDDLLIIEFDTWEHCDEYVDALPDIVADPGSGFPGGWVGLSGKVIIHRSV